MTTSDVLDTVAIASVSAGLGWRFGWWLAAVVAGCLVIAVNYARSA